LVRFPELSWRGGAPLAPGDIDFTRATPEKGILDSLSSTLDAIRRVLEGTGIEFLSLHENSEDIRVRPPRAPISA
jgi:hypothetical protein